MHIRPFLASDAESLADLSVRSFDSRDIMSKMGRRYLANIFFPAAAEDESALGRVAVENGAVIAYSLGFLDLQAFYARVRRENFVRNLALLSQKVVSLRLTPFDILNIALSDRKVFRHVPSPAHWGPIAVSAELRGTPRGGAVMLATSRHILDDLAARGVSECWGIADSRNEASWRFIEALKFRRLAEIPLFGRLDYLYGRALNPPG